MIDVSSNLRIITAAELLSETTSQELYTKSLQIGNCDKKIEELSRTIHNLESDLSNLKVGNFYLFCPNPKVVTPSTPKCMQF